MDKQTIFDLPFVKEFTQLCIDGCKQGWNEANGGNLSYRMTKKDALLAMPFFNQEPGPWVEVGLATPEFGGEYLLITGSGQYLINVARKPKQACGIIELNPEGSAYRIRWGLENGRPSSELPTHLTMYSKRCEKTQGETRVVYHTHPETIVAMTQILPLETKVFTRKLWAAMNECIIIFPEGVGVVPWTVPGGTEIAEVTRELVEQFNAIIWAQHGLLCAGKSFDEAYGLTQTLEKAAGVYCKARAMNGGSDDFLNAIPAEGLLRVATAFNLSINKELLGE